MSLRLPTRAVAPVIVLAILGGIVATFMVHRTLPTTTQGDLPTAAELAKHPQQPAKPKAKAKKPVVAKTATPAKPKAKAPARPKAKAPARPKAVKPKVAAVPAAPVRKPVEAPKGDPVDAHGLPLVLSRALAKNPVTVVALYDPSAELDELALAEARAGAADAKAAFLAINVFNEPQVRPLAQLLGVLNSPSLLVYKRPNTLFVRIDGFSDRQTVAQAAANARS
jgi:outer membrane biosynthesis protein TonB